MTIKNELPKILAAIDAGNPMPLNLVQVASANPGDLGQNHQVLAYRYDIDDGQSRRCCAQHTNVTAGAFGPAVGGAPVTRATIVCSREQSCHFCNARCIAHRAW